MPIPEELVWVKGREPVAVGVCVVVAGASAVTLDEGNLPELLEAGSWRGQRLARSLGANTGLLQEYIYINL